MPLYISEYAAMAQVSGAQMAQDPPLATQVLAIGAGSVQSAPLNPATRFLRLHTDAVCCVSVGLNAVADPSFGRFAANQTEYRGVPERGNFTVAVIITT